MEWTKEKLNYTCIKITSASQMKKVVEFYKSFGIEGDITEFHGKDKGMIIYVRNDHMWVDFGLLATSSVNGNKIIKLPSKPRRKFPREMMVSDDKINWVERIVYGKVKSENPYIAKLELNTHKDKYLFGAWKYAKEID